MTWEDSVCVFNNRFECQGPGQGRYLSPSNVVWQLRIFFDRSCSAEQKRKGRIMMHCKAFQRSSFFEQVSGWGGGKNYMMRSDDHNRNWHHIEWRPKTLTEFSLVLQLHRKSPLLVKRKHRLCRIEGNSLQVDSATMRGDFSNRPPPTHTCFESTFCFEWLLVAAIQAPMHIVRLAVSEVNNRILYPTIKTAGPTYVYF